MTSAVQNVMNLAASLSNKTTIPSNELSTCPSRVLSADDVAGVLSRYLAALGAVVRFRAESYVAIRQRLNAAVAVPLDVTLHRYIVFHLAFRRICWQHLLDRFSLLIMVLQLWEARITFCR